MVEFYGRIFLIIGIISSLIVKERKLLGHLATRVKFNQKKYIEVA